MVRWRRGGREGFCRGVICVVQMEADRDDKNDHEDEPAEEHEVIVHLEAVGVVEARALESHAEERGN